MKNSLISIQLVKDITAKGIKVKRWPRWRRIGRLDPMVTLYLPNGISREIFLDMSGVYFLGYTVQAASRDINEMLKQAADELAYYL